MTSSGITLSLQEAEKEGALFILIMRDAVSRDPYPLFLKSGERVPSPRSTEDTFCEIFDVQRWILRGRPVPEMNAA